MNMENRLAKLERENRTWRLAAISMAAILGLSIACSGPWNEPAPGLRNQVAAQASETPIHDWIRVRNLEIVDESGQAVGRWSCRRGRPTLEILAGDKAVTLQAGYVVFRQGDLDTFIQAGRVAIRRTGPKQRQAEAQLLEEEGLSATERERLLEESIPDSIVILDGSEPTGAGLYIYNHFGENVATLQSSKTNQGLLVISDVNGKPVRGLSGGQ